jgi:hypothetical protein
MSRVSAASSIVAGFPCRRALRTAPRLARRAPDGVQFCIREVSVAVDPEFSPGRAPRDLAARREILDRAIAMGERVHGYGARQCPGFGDLRGLGLRPRRMRLVGLGIAPFIARRRAGIVTHGEQARNPAPQIGIVRKARIGGGERVRPGAHHHRPMHRVELDRHALGDTLQAREIETAELRERRREGVGHELDAFGAGIVKRLAERADQLARQRGLETQPIGQRRCSAEQIAQGDAAVGPAREIARAQTAAHPRAQFESGLTHRLEIEPEPAGRGARVAAEIEERAVERVGRVFGPVDPQPVDIRIARRQIGGHRRRVGADFGGSERRVVVDARIGRRAIGQARPILVFGPAELHAIAGRARGLDLQVDFEPARFGARDGAVDDGTFRLRQRIGNGRLVTQARIELRVGHEAGRGAHEEFAPSPQRPVEQAHLAGTGVGGRFARALAVGCGGHDVRRGRDGGGARAAHEIVEGGVHAFGLEKLGKNRDADELGHDQPIRSRRSIPSPGVSGAVISPSFTSSRPGGARSNIGWWKTCRSIDSQLASDAARCRFASIDTTELEWCSVTGLK